MNGATRVVINQKKFDRCRYTSDAITCKTLELQQPPKLLFRAIGGATSYPR